VKQGQVCDKIQRVDAKVVGPCDHWKEGVVLEYERHRILCVVLRPWELKVAVRIQVMSEVDEVIGQFLEAEYIRKVCPMCLGEGSAHCKFF